MLHYTYRTVMRLNRVTNSQTTLKIFLLTLQKSKISILSTFSVANEHRCNLSAHARVLSLIEGKWKKMADIESVM